MNDYEIRFINQHGTLVSSGFGSGNSAMEAAENAITSYGMYLSPNEPVYVVAINLKTGIGFKFEMSQGTI